MAHFNFVIPLNKDDLFEAPTRNQYTVENVYNSRDIKIKLADCSLQVQQIGADFILREGFDIIFSLITEYHKAATIDMKQHGFTVMMRSMEKLVQNLASVLNTGGVLDTDERISYLNCLKMNLYLFCQLVELIEGDQTNSIDAVTGGKKKGGKKTRDDDFTWDWDSERLQSVTILYNLLQLPLNPLFDPPMMEEEVVTQLASTCFKILENPVMAFQNKRDTRLSIMQVLGTMNKKYNYTLSCSLKFVQHLKHFEHLVSVLGQATEVLVRDFSSNAMVMELVREISRIDPRELARDTSGTRSYSLFLVELAERLPDMMKPSLAILSTHLDGESYTMRKCVLAVMGEIVAKVLSREDLDDAGRDDRDGFLDCLEDHMHDVHAHVRSHVLQIWGKLCKEKCIPLSRQHSVLELAVGRLQDKSSNVRKAAVQLLTTLLESNPFAAKLGTMELEIKLKEEEAKLKEMAPEEVEKVDPVQVWNDLKEKVKEKLVETLRERKGEGEDEDEQTEKCWENAASLEVCQRIGDFIEKLNISKALSLLRSAQETFPEEDVFEVDRGSTPSSESPPVSEQGEEDAEAEKNVDMEEVKNYLSIFKNVFFETKKKPDMDLSQSLSEGPSQDESQNQSQHQSKDELIKQKLLVQLLKDSLKFSKIIHKSLPVVAQLLGSKQNSDILEAIDFFVSAFEFGLLDAMIGVRRMLSLIWSQEKTIKDAVVAAYKRLYISVDSNNSRTASNAIAKNLIALVVGATLGEETSLEKLVSEFVLSKDIGKGVFQVLFEYFTGVMPNSRPEESRAAILILGMCALSEVTIVTSNIQNIIDFGIGEKGLNDFRLAGHSCQTLLRMVPTKLNQEDQNPPKKFDTDHQLFQQIERLLVEGIEFEKDHHYMPMAKYALEVIFKLGEGPDRFTATIVRKICEKIKSQEPEDGGELKVKNFILSRLCYLTGQIALCHLNYLDVNIFNELKRRNYLREQKKDNELKKKKDLEAKKKKRTSMIRSTAMETPKTGAEDDDMGVVGAEADDAEAEFIRNICENELLYGDTLLATISPLILNVCSNPSKFPDPDLRSSASLALSKFMLVSSEFCESHLQLLFTVLERSVEPIIRANLIIALGDMSFRFPNTVEPWTPRMYARLHDDSVSVRSNTLTVLTHLILNDMIKVKGQISDMACCIVDSVDKIAGLAKLFFAELSKKGNTLYNVMPDIVSRLSDNEKGVEEENFRTIMKYIIGLIEKDKLLESLVEKLCLRFRATRTERQWRDISYCLSLFPYSDRSMKKLSENFGCWSDKLHDDDVYDCFVTIFAGVKKGGGLGVAADSRAAAKQLLEELEGKVEEARQKAVIDHKAEKNAQAAKEGKKKGGKAEEKKSAPKTTKKKQAVYSDTEDDEEMEAEEAEEEKEDDIEEEPMEEENAETEPTKTTKTKGGKSSEPSGAVAEEGRRGARRGGRRMETSDEEQQPPKSAKKGKKPAEEQEDSEDDFQDKRPTRRTRRKQ